METIEPQECQHQSCIPAYDSEVCKDKSPYWIRQHFPLFEGVCPECSQQVIVYASMEHYIMGDY